MKELQRQGNPNIVIALAGNKSDLNSKRKVEPEEAESYASDNGIFFYGDEREDGDKRQRALRGDREKAAEEHAAAGEPARWDHHHDRLGGQLFQKGMLLRSVVSDGRCCC